MPSIPHSRIITPAHRCTRFFPWARLIAIACAFVAVGAASSHAQDLSDLVATITAPAGGATAADLTQPIQWTAVANAQAYYLYLGSSLGAKDLVNTGEIRQTSYQPASLPTGQIIYARLWTRVDGVWRFSDSSFTAAAVASLAAVVTRPLNGTTDAELSQPIQWTSVPNAQAYYLYIGSTAGARDLVNTGEIQQTSYQATALPAGQLLYARLWTKAGGVWRYNDSTFFGYWRAMVTYPANGATNVNLALPIQWTSVPGAQAYFLYIGSTSGAKDLVNSGEIQQTSYVVSAPMPATQTVYVRLWTKGAGVWRYNDSTFTTTPVVGAYAVVPNWGPGAKQTFTLTYYDSAGATDLSTAKVWFSANGAGGYANSCVLSYDVARNTLALMNDAGTDSVSVILGSAGMLSNSQCFVTMGASSSAISRDNLLTLNLALTFTPAFAGEKNIYMLAADPWVSTGWGARGTWTVPNAATSFVLTGDRDDVISGGQGLFFTPDDGPLTASVNSNNGVSLAFHTSTYSHWWYLDFSAPNNQFLTVGTYTGATRFSSPSSSQPGQMVQGDGHACYTLTGSFEVKEIRYGLGGAVTSFWATFEQHCDGLAPAARGEIRFNASVPVAAMLTYPAHRSINADLSQPFRWTSVANAEAYSLYIGTSRGASDLLNSGELHQTWYTLAGWLPANQTLYARLWTKIGGVMLYIDSSFTAMPIVPSTVSLETIAPNWGTATRQTFALQFSPTGETDLFTARVWFSASATSSAQSCLVSYDRVANALWLLNDTASDWIRGTVGSTGTLANSQCIVALGSSTAALSDQNDLTLNLAMTFLPAFSGPKNIYMSAASASATSGWQSRGTWTVPAATTSLALSGETGDYISGGQGFFFTPDDGSFTASVNYDNGVSLAFRTPTYGHSWSLDFAAPNKQSLTAGTYTGAARFPFQASNQPGLDVSGDGRGCNTLNGSFTVKEITYGTGGTVASFWATFEQHCEGQTPAARGEIRFNASVQMAALLTFPQHVSTNADLTRPFQWTSVPNAQGYYLYVGTALGAKDLVNTGEIRQTSYLAGTPLPTDQTLYARIWTKIAGVWRYNDSSFTALPIAQVTAMPDIVIPDSGTGARQTFALQYSDAAGAAALSTARVWFNGAFASNTAHSCMVFYDRAANALSLLNDAGDNWVRAALGGSGTLSNGQCFITLGNGTTATSSGNVLTLNLAMTFTPAFNGAKTIYMAAADATASSGWQPRGTWNVPGASTSLVLTGDQGDYISGAQAMFFTSDDGLFSASKNYDNGVSLTFRTPTYSHWWNLDFGAAGNQFLTVGTYTGAARFPFQASSQPGLSVSGDGRGCNTLTGTFDVKQITFGTAGAVQSFWATFEQHCEGGAPAARGEIRYNATVQ